MVCVNDWIGLHSPVWINGVNFTRCLIDSGSKVNLISVKDAIKHGFTYEMGGIKKIMGFNGSSSSMDGLMDSQTWLGPNGKPREVEFWVCSNTIIPLLGCLALTELGLMMDCRERNLADDQGNVMRCCVVHTLKN